MFPVLLQIGPFTISSLGFFISLAFFFGSFEVWKKAKEEHFDDDDIFDAILLSFLGGIIFSRFFYIIFHFSKFGFVFNRWINLSYSNQFSWLGFLFGVMYVIRLISKKRKWDFFSFMDYTVFGVVVAQSLVRIGQFLDGSYVGKATNFFLGMNFPGIEGRRHPLTLYEVVFLIIFFQFLKWLDKRYRLFKWYQRGRSEAASGFLWLSYMLGFLLFQFVIEFYRDRKFLFFIFSSYHLYLILFIGLDLFVFWLRAGNKISFVKNEKKELEVIRKPMKEEKPKERRFSREKNKRVGFK